jgi:protein-S-isoprenylcysteine O-methyltransferase Ste14
VKALNKPVVLLLLVVLLAAFSLTHVIPAKAGTLPPPFLIAATIVALVAVCGAVFSLCVRKRGKKSAE